MRGTKPKPTAQKRLEGNVRRLNRHEPQPPPVTDVSVPSVLHGDGMAMEEWRRLAPIPRPCRQLTDAGTEALTADCREWSIYVDATTALRTEGLVLKSRTGFRRVNPQLVVARTALNSCIRLWAELGMTPSSRSRVTQSGSGPGPEGD